MEKNSIDQQNQTIKPNDPVSLKTVIRIYFPDGSVSLRRLLRKIEDGDLIAWNIGGEFLTSRIEIESMLEKCRVTPSRRDSGFVSPVAQSKGGAQKREFSSSSVTEAKLARDVAVKTAQRLKQNLPSS